MPCRGCVIFTCSTDTVGVGCGGWLGKERNMAVEELTEREMEVLITVFRSFETGLREATIYPKVMAVYEVPNRSIECLSNKPYII